jgi:hypothetical protein
VWRVGEDESRSTGLGDLIRSIQGAEAAEIAAVPVASILIWVAGP